MSSCNLQLLHILSLDGYVAILVDAMKISYDSTIYSILHEDGLAVMSVSPMAYRAVILRGKQAADCDLY